MRERIPALPSFAVLNPAYDSYSGSQLGETFLWTARLGVPSPLVGEGQDRGSHRGAPAARPLTLSLCGALINQGPTGEGTHNRKVNKDTGK